MKGKAVMFLYGIIPFLVLLIVEVVSGISDKLIAVQLYKAPSSIKQDGVKLLHHDAVGQAESSKICNVVASSNSSKEILQDAQNVLTLASGTFLSASVTSSRSNQPVIFFNASFDLNATQIKSAKHLFATGEVRSIKISAFSLENVQQVICRVFHCPKLSMCVEKVTTAKFAEYKAMLEKATNVSNINRTCTIEAAKLQNILASLSPIKSSEIIDKQLLPQSSSVATQISKFTVPPVPALELLTVHEGIGTLQLLTTIFTENKVYLNMTVTFGAYSKNFSDAFLKGMTNMNSSLSGVVFNITYKPAQQQPVPDINWWFTSDGLVNLVLLLILALYVSVIILALVFWACNRSGKAFDLEFWDMVWKMEQQDKMSSQTNINLKSSGADENLN